MRPYHYRWILPPEKVAQFVLEWGELTRFTQAHFGLVKASLFGNDTPGELFSITEWESSVHRSSWYLYAQFHPFLIKWRAYKLATAAFEADQLTLLETVKQKSLVRA